MDLEIQIALLGILGTLGGTILGWWLNNLSQRGKLNIYISEWKDKFEYNNVGIMTQSSNIEQAQCYSYNLSLDLYNSSGETKIMRNIEIVFANGKKDLFCSIPKDDSTKQICHPFMHYEDILPVNIPPKSVLHIGLHNGLWDSDNSFGFIWQTTHIYFRYKNEKNKTKNILINKEKYKDYFSNHPMEETQ